MIDRLEELLDRLEEPEKNEDTVLLEQLQPVSLPSRPAERKEREAGEMNEAERTESGYEGGTVLATMGGQVDSPLLEELSYSHTDYALQMLYRQLTRATEGGATGKSASVAVVRETVPAGHTGLTAGELDLAMRRDSRRYDGGMTIY